MRRNLPVERFVKPNEPLAIQVNMLQAMLQTDAAKKKAYSEWQSENIRMGLARKKMRLTALAKGKIPVAGKVVYITS